MTVQTPTSTAPQAGPGGRVLSIDRVRALAIVLALFSHGMGVATGGWWVLDDHPEAYEAARLVTRTATPVFLVLLGASTEFAYVRLWARDPAQARRKLLRRALQCWFAVLAVAAAALIGGAEPRRQLLGAVFLDSPQGGEIFELYVAMFLLMLLVVPFRLRFGLAWTAALALAVWPVAEVLQQWDPQGSPVAHLVSRVAGLGAETGPSVLHSLVLVVLGMTTGRFVLDRRRGRPGPGGPLLAAAVVLAALTAVLTIRSLTFPGYSRGIVDITGFRVQNHPAYFASGFLVAVVLVLLAGAALRLRVGGPARTGPFSRSSLLAFTLGNVLINLVLVRVPTPGLVADAGASAALIAGLWLAMRFLPRRRQRPPRVREPLPSA